MINISHVKILNHICNNYKLDDVRTLDFLIREEKTLETYYFNSILSGN
jgi:hypothetical protein